MYVGCSFRPPQGISISGAAHTCVLGGLQLESCGPAHQSAVAVQSALPLPRPPRRPHPLPRQPPALRLRNHLRHVHACPHLVTPDPLTNVDVASSVSCCLHSSSTMLATKSKLSHPQTRAGHHQCEHLTSACIPMMHQMLCCCLQEPRPAAAAVLQSSPSPVPAPAQAPSPVSCPSQKL